MPLNLGSEEACGSLQVKLANELQKPLFLHCRDAAERFTAILREEELSVPAVAHCFTGSREELAEYCRMGLHIGITGWVRVCSRAGQMSPLCTCIVSPT